MTHGITIEGFLKHTKHQNNNNISPNLSASGVPEAGIFTKALTNGDGLKTPSLNLFDDSRDNTLGGGLVDIVLEGDGAAGVEPGTEVLQAGINVLKVLVVFGVDVDRDDLVAELGENGQGVR